MREIPRYVYISPIIFLFIFFAWTIGKVKELIILYFVVIIHELAHIAIAKIYKLKTEKILITPVGINAKINFGKDNSYSEIIISLAGPVLNLIMIGIGLTINSYFLTNSRLMEFFITSNIAILLLNILPVLPLDGGRVFKNFLLKRIGYKRTIRLLSGVSIITSLIFIILGIYQLFNCWYNLSLLFIGIFIYLCSYKEKEQIEFTLIRELIYKNQNIIKSKIYNIRYMACIDKVQVIDIIKDMQKGKYHIVKVINECSQIIGELNEGQLFNSIVILGYNSNLGDAIRYYSNKDCKT